MNTNPTNQIIRRSLLTVLLAGLSALPAHAQYTFNCGSTGTWHGDGVMNITANTTLDMPDDGIFNCTTINVAAGATLKFTPNSLNTPVYLLATGDVTISGTIDVSGSMGTASAGGAGGPGGYAGGNPGFGGLAASDGHGPGAGKAGNKASNPFVGSAGYAANGNNRVYSTEKNGSAYGSPLLVPMVGGSGGGGCSDGLVSTGGGGVLLIASNTTIVVNGSLLAPGGSANAGSTSYTLGLGSGGAIRLLCPLVRGTGTLNVLGGVNTAWGSSFSMTSSGRIRIDCMDRRSLNLTYSPSTSVSIGANMMTFPPNPPHLDITHVAGRVVEPGSARSFTLPQDSPTNQTVIVQATNFGGVVPIRVVLTPDNGSSTSYDAQIDNTAAGSASVTVDVVVPVNVNVSVEVWTR